jgi:Holliday junction resolvasome RuvABC ATP-dependent DNA helicase subunit
MIMSRGIRLTKKEKSSIKSMFASGLGKEEIATIMSLSMTTISRHTSGVVVGKSKCYCINATKEDWDFVSEISQSKSITKLAALSEVVRLAKRRSLFSWGTK